ncbi:hypothetical protein [Kitasatospora viridis]|uniref:Uncharacterized protein n=1 Tax=Kitasatospora viridis TaxID=281105 RepID=A0A561SFS8_9ACTN|nr:hypothetical protein [Kitasatospora viridis]TWF73735.1 hypothetical protein FHX73_15362 [Kitasatospora viridis]
MAQRLPGPPPLELVGIADREHPRVVRALRFREEVRVWEADGGLVLLTAGGS